MNTVQITKEMQIGIEQGAANGKTVWVVYQDDFAIVTCNGRAEARELKGDGQKIAKASDLALVVEMTSVPGMVESAVLGEQFSDADKNTPVLPASGDVQPIGELVKAEETERYMTEGMAVSQAVTAAVEKLAKPKTPKIPMLRISEIDRPCKQVWHIADSMKADILVKMQAEQKELDIKFPPTDKDALALLRRKDVLAKCVASGIAFYTARTQYQLWLTIQNGGSI